MAEPRDLPDIERLEDAGLLQRPANEIDLDGAFGIVEDDGQYSNSEIGLMRTPSSKTRPMTHRNSSRRACGDAHARESLARDRHFRVKGSVVGGRQVLGKRKWRLATGS